MAFPQNFLQEIKNRIAVSDVVGRSVKLQRRGREFVGLSPFKQERTPSFTVNDDKQFYHCFSTGKHGSIFDFLMETEGLNFPEAVERLARETGLPMPERDPQMAQRAAQQATLIDVTQAAAKWFTTQLNSDVGADARDYLARRGIDETLIGEFGLGFAPKSRTGLIEYLTARNINMAQIVASGMAIKPDGNGAPYDRFRDRVMFPIADTGGRIIAFGGRAMQAGERAKYLNSPETPIFHKGRELFNFARARKPAHDNNIVLVAEGYMDVIGLARAGINHAVASLGTAITEGQIQLLWRLAPEPILCLDGDEAGLRAAYRAIDRALPLLKPGYSLRFARLPAGKDPDDLVAEGGAEAMRELLDKARNLDDVLWEREIEIAPYNTPERAADLKKRLRKAVGQIGDPDLRTLYGQKVKKRLDKLLDNSDASYKGGQQAKTRRNYRGGRRAGTYDNVIPFRQHAPALQETRQSAIAQGASDYPPSEVLLLAGILNYPSILCHERDKIDALDLQSEGLKKLRFAIIDYFDALDAPIGDVVEDAEALDKDTLKGHLKGLDMSEIVERVLALAMNQNVKWVRGGQGLAEALPVWRDVANVHHKLKTLMAEKQAVEAEYADDLNEETFNRLKAIKNEIDALATQSGGL
ncbi:MAG: DNA primase [Parvibaculales bacterium]